MCTDHLARGGPISARTGGVRHAAEPVAQARAVLVGEPGANAWLGR
jgi:hypothetical protein